MTLQAALPGAALRVMRMAAGRRALHVVLLVGGLFALGFLCGERAYAADGTVPTSPTELVQSVTGSAKNPVTNSADRIVKPTAGRVARSSTKALAPAKRSPLPAARNLGSVVTDTDTLTPTVHRAVPPVADRVVRPLTDRVVRPAAGNVARPVGDLGDLLKTATAELTHTPPAALRPLPGLPTFPALPSLPGLSALPRPGSQLPPSAPPQQSGGVAHEPDPAKEQTGAGQHPGPETASESGAGAGVTPAVSEAHRDRQGLQGATAPAHQSPVDDPTGALGNQSAVDNGGPRHGDPYAVTPNHRAPLRLVPGAPAAVAAADTRDRHRDIPVFPG